MEWGTAPIRRLVESVHRLYLHSHKLPIVVFYRYMWENNRSLLVKTLFFNYIFQLVLEALPWWASRRKVGNKLRTARIKLNHNMVTGKDWKWKLMRDFVYKTLMFAFLDSLNRYIKNRVALENKFEIRRLVMEKVLYAEVGELEKIKTQNLELKVASDITQTLNFINNYLPSLVSGLYAFLVEGSSLLMRRKALDPLALAYPILITVLTRIIAWAQWRWFTKHQKKLSRSNQDRLESSMANALEGIVDIQTNNLQPIHLQEFDDIAQEEIRNKEGLVNLFLKTFSTLNKMSAFAYIIEIWCVHKIMNRQNLDYKQYSKIQQEIDHVVTIGRRTFNLLRRTKHILKYQSKVVKLLDIRNFLTEQSKLPAFEMTELKELRLERVVFWYRHSLPPALDLRDADMVFLPGRRYAIIGQNKAGKSTLMKILTKLYAPSEGEVYINGHPYSQIPRVQLREYMSYIPQRPLIIAGSIKENILMGNPHATEEDIIFAAEASGLLEFLGTGMDENLEFSDSDDDETSPAQASPPTLATGLHKSTSSVPMRGFGLGTLTEEPETNGGDDSAAPSTPLGSTATIEPSSLPTKLNKHSRKASQPLSSTAAKQKARAEKKEAKKLKRRQKRKKNRKRRDDSGDDDSDDSGDGMTRTLSFAELGEIVQPHGGFYDSTFSTAKYPVSLSRSGAHQFEDDSDSDLDDDGDDSDDYGNSDADKEEEEMHAYQVEDDEGSDGEESKTPRGTTRPPIPPLKVKSLSQPGDTLTANAEAGGLRRIPKSISTPNLQALGQKRPIRNAKAILEQKVSAGGTDVSGGFAQSIALARVFVRRHAKIVILDEATGQMDQVKLRTIVFPKLFEFIREYNICLIVITHNLVIVMHEGTVNCQGGHMDLLEQKQPLYMDLFGIHEDDGLSDFITTPRRNFSTASLSLLGLRAATSGSLVVPDRSADSTSAATNPQAPK